MSGSIPVPKWIAAALFAAFLGAGSFTAKIIIDMRDAVVLMADDVKDRDRVIDEVKKEMSELDDKVEAMREREQERWTLVREDLGRLSVEVSQVKVYAERLLERYERRQRR